MVSPFAWRGGLFLSWVGFAVVTSDGNEVSRLRAACRALIGWIPAIAYILLAAHQRLAFVTRWLYVNDPIMAIIAPIEWPVAGMPLVVAAFATVAGVWAVCRPARGIQDWLTGTWLVYRCCSLRRRDDAMTVWEMSNTRCISSGPALCENPAEARSQATTALLKPSQGALPQESQPSVPAQHGQSRTR